MARTDLLIPIIVAVIGLLGSIFSLYLSWRTEHRAHRRQVAALTEKYTQPLLVAAYDLQQRLYELVEYPISRQHLSMREGIDDLKIYTCYLLAQYLGRAHILRTKTGYLSFAEEPKLRHLRALMYLIDEELDRRRDAAGRNVGVWPAAHVLVAERMLTTGADANDAIDGGVGVDVQGYDQFFEKWEEKFQEPMHYFCGCINRILEGRLKGEEDKEESHFRCLQHLLVDVVNLLDRKGAYIVLGQWDKDLKCRRSAVYCDCERCWPKDPNDDMNQNYEGLALKDPPRTRLNAALKNRQDSRLNDSGLWANGHKNDTVCC